MGTRSDIIVQRQDGKYARIYCHWDGYIDHNGKILYAHYNSQELAEKLTQLGDLSVLAPRANKPKGHTFDTPKKGYCIAYGRDRGEKDVDATVVDTLAEAWPEQDTWTEFTYVWSRELGGKDFENGAWWVGDPDEGSQTLKLLAEVIAGVAVIKTAIKVPFLGASKKVQRT